MRRVNINELAAEEWASPKGKFASSGKGVTEALGGDPVATDDLRKRLPFDVELTRIPPGKLPYPFHSHSAQWEFYLIVAGNGKVRDAVGLTEIEPGDAFIFAPGQAHQLINDGTEDLLFYVVADNPVGESCYYPDSNKWLVRSPERRLLRSEPLDYFDGEE